MLGAPLAPVEQRAGDDREQERKNHRRRGPAPHAALNQAEGEAAQRHDAEHLGLEIEVAVLVPRHGRHVAQREQNAQHAHGQVHEKHAAPGPGVREDAAHHGPGGDGEAGGGGPDADRLGPLGRVVIGVP